MPIPKDTSNANKPIPMDTAPTSDDEHPELRKFDKKIIEIIESEVCVLSFKFNLK
jgi:hypothetical protein